MAIVPVIQVVSDSSGFAPFTVHVDASLSNFDGKNPSDCIYKWNFGDPNPPLNGHQDNNRYDSLGAFMVDTSLVQGNYKNKTRFNSPTTSFGIDNTGYGDRGGDSNLKQQGINAAYTYYHNNGGTPFTITLSIINAGVESSTTTTTITVTAPTIYTTATTTANMNNPAHAVNAANAWVSLQVCQAFSSESTSDGASRRFSSLENAFAWIGTFRTTGSPGGVNGRVRIAFANTSGQFENPISNTLNITQDNIVFTVTDGNYISGGYVIKNNNSGGLSAPGTPTAMINISGAKNIYFENLTFRGVYSSNSGTPTSNIICVQIDNSRNITFNNCGFKSSYNGIHSVDLDTVGVYVNHSIFGGGENGYVNRNSIFRMSGYNIVFSNIEIKRHDNSTLYNIQDSIFDLGNGIGIINSTIQWCHIDASIHVNSVYQSSNSSLYANVGSAANGGCFSTYLANNLFLMSNAFLNGCNTISDSTYCRVDGNYIMLAGGGQKTSSSVNTISSQAGCVSVKGVSSSISITSNVFNNLNGNLMGNLFCFIGAGAKSGINIINNTAIVSINVSSLIGAWDFTANGATISSCIFANNLTIEDKIQVLCNIFRYESLSIFSAFTKNVFTEKGTTGIRFAIVNGTYRDTEWWIANSSSNSLFYTVEITDAIINRKFTFSSNKYPSIKNYCSIYNSVNQDYAKNLISSASCDAGATTLLSEVALFPGSISSTPITTVITNSFRSRPTNTNAVANDSQNLYIEMYDPDVQHQDNTGLTSNKRLMGRSFGTRSADTNSNPYSNLLSCVGDYIKTQVSTQNTSDGVDVTITYTNDGPFGQATGIAAQRLGALDFDSIFIGRGATYSFSRTSNRMVDDLYHVKSGLNLNSGAAATYPSNRFCPVSSYLTEKHVITISLLANFFGENKDYQEIILSRNDFFGYVIGRARTRLIWRKQGSPINDCVSTDVPSDYLLQGQSFSVTVSIRVSRNPSKWVLTTKPLRDYYISNKTMLHSRDPRPLLLENLNSNYVGIASPNYTPLEMSDDYRIPQTGYAAYRSNRLSHFANNKAERYMIWDVIGAQTEVGSVNYYPHILTPLWRNQVPHTSYPLMLSTISEIRRLAEELPSFIFYQGYGSSTSTGPIAWGASVITTDISSTNITNPTIIQKFYDELDIAFDHLWAAGVGLDAINRDQASLDLLDLYYDRYPHIHMLSEVAPPDVICFKTSCWLFSNQGTSGPHDLANYLVPGNEIMLGDWGVREDFMYANNSEAKSRVKTFAQYGYTPGPNNGVSFDVTESTLIGVDRRFDYQPLPSYTGVAYTTPTGLNYAFYNAVRNTTYAAATSPLTTYRKYIKLTWDANTHPLFSSFIVYKSKVTNGVVSSTDIRRHRYTKNPYFYDNAVREGSTYYYQISTIDVYGNESAKTTAFPVLFVADDPVLNAPTSISAVPNYNQGNIGISWSS